MATSTNKPTLDVCYQVRKLLVDNGIENLGEDFPIIEAEHGGMLHDNHYLGFANVTREGWEHIDKTHMISKINKTKSVEVCLTDPTSKESYGDSEDGKQKRQWQYNAHDDNFYDSFAKILDVAEKLGIYKLPSGFCKNNRQALRRFDSVDVDGKNVFVGHSTLFKEVTQLKWPLTQTVSVANEKGEMKLVVIKAAQKDVLLEELREGCMKKFQIKKKKAVLKFSTLKGDSIDSNDSLLNVLDQKEQITFKIT